MKKFIAFDTGNNAHSGVQTKDNASNWAKDRVTKNPSVQRVLIAEVIETVERVQPAVEIKPFLVEAGEEEPKTAHKMVVCAAS